MNRQKVLIVGGTGYFGSLLIDDLLVHAGCDVIVASRRPFRSSRFETIVADLADPASLERALTGVSIAICAAGPFQGLPTGFAKLCMEREIHYIDLADDRGYVRKIRSLAAGMPRLDSVVCTGWSTVSALSALMSRIAAVGMSDVDVIHIQMAPGNRGARNFGTIASLLHSVGRPFTVFRDGNWRTVPGWSEPREFVFPFPVGVRRGYIVDVPDHELFPDLFGARTVEFRAGSELRILNECLSLLRRTGWSWVKWSAAFQRVAALLSWMGHDRGAVGVEVSGSARRRVSIVADSHAERMAVMPASIMANSLLYGESLRGLLSPADWLTRDQLRTQCEKRDFRLIVEEL